MQRYYFLLFASLVFLQGPSTVHGLGTPQAYYNVSRIELDPDASTVAAGSSCPTNFSDILAAMVSQWFVDAVASEKGSYPPVINPGGVLKKGVFRKEPIANRQLRSTSSRKEEEEEQVEGHRRLPCSITSCNNCCPSYCNTYCGGNGNCNLCRRVLRATTGGAEARKMALSDDNNDDSWWWGNSTYQNKVASSIQFAAQRWLNQNDQTRCMGNPWGLTVTVNFF